MLFRSTQIFTFFFFFFFFCLTLLFDCLATSACIGGVSYTDTSDVLAVAAAAALPDLGCRRNSISVSACPHKVRHKKIKNQSPIIKLNYKKLKRYMIVEMCHKHSTQTHFYHIPFDKPRFVVSFIIKKITQNTKLLN